MREGGLLTTGARGVNAPQATTLDAARLLIAMMLNSKLPTVVEDVKLIGQFVPLRPEKLPAGFKPDTLENGLALLIDYAAKMDANGVKMESIAFRLQPYKAMANIEIVKGKGKSVSIDLSLPDVRKWVISGPFPDTYREAYSRFPVGFYQEPMITEKELVLVGKLVMGSDQ